MTSFKRSPIKCSVSLNIVNVCVTLDISGIKASKNEMIQVESE